MSDEYGPEDEFTDDLGESVGYDVEFDWEKLDQAEVQLHDEIAEMDVDAIRALDESKLTDLQLWSLAQAWAEFDDDAAFERIALKLVRGSAKHPALDYGEIAVEIVNDWLYAGEFDQARELLPRVQELTPDDPHLTPRFRAIMTALEGDQDSALEQFEDLLERAEEDLELQMAVGLDMFSVGFLDEAEEVFTECREAANSEGYLELVEDLDAALADLARARAGGDIEED